MNLESTSHDDGDATTSETTTEEPTAGGSTLDEAAASAPGTDADTEVDAGAEAEVAEAGAGAEVAEAGDRSETATEATAETATEATAETPGESETGGTSGRRRGRGRRAASRPAGPPAAFFSAADAPQEPGGEVMVRPSVHTVAAVFMAPVLPATVESAPSEAEADAESPRADQTQETRGESADEASAGEKKTGGDTGEQPSAESGEGRRRRRRRGGRGRGRRAEGDAEGRDADEDDTPRADADAKADASGGESGDAAETGDKNEQESAEAEESAGSKRRRRRRRGKGGDQEAAETPPGDEVTAIKGSTRLEAKKQRRREGRANRGQRAPILTEAEFLARRESVDRRMVVRQIHGITQIGVLEDKVLVEHYVGSQSNSSMIGNVYLGRVQNVLPSMEAAFVDIGRGRNGVLYAGEVNWEAAGLEGQPKRIELALSPGDTVLVQVTKDPVGHKGARLTSQVSLPGRFLVYVPEGGMTGISRKLPDRERSRLKKILRAILPEEAGVIVRTAAEGASEDQLRQDVERLATEWQRIQQDTENAHAPVLLRSEPDLAIKVARDIFNEDFTGMAVAGDDAYRTVSDYVSAVAPDLVGRVTKWTGPEDLFAAERVDEQLTKALDRKVWLPSGGSLVIDRTEAMTVIDVNTGKFVGKGGNLEETVTRNNLEAAEEIVRQLRLRDIGGIIVIDFIDMVVESNRDLVLRRLVECLSRDRTKHQVAEVTSLGLVQMTRKRIGQGLLETFSTPCEACGGRGIKLHTEPVGHTPVESRVVRVRRQKITGAIPGAPVHARTDDDVESEVQEPDAPEPDAPEPDAPEPSPTTDVVD